MDMDSKRNSLVDVTRMVCAFFVIAIHTNLGIENELTWILFQTIARIAVPYFLVVTGWFFYRNILINQRVIFKYIMNLLRAYLIASMPFAAVFAIKNNKSGTFLGFTGGITLEGTVNASVVFSGNNTCAGGLLVNLYS